MRADFCGSYNCSAVFPLFALNIERNFTLRYDLRRGFCARLNLCLVPRRAVLFALAVPLCSHRMPLRKTRKRIFRSVFVRERGNE